jgi:hypothetical protein
MNNTIDDNDKRYLFAYGITDGALDNMTEEQRSVIIRVIESFLKEHKSANSDQTHTKYHF